MKKYEDLLKDVQHAEIGTLLDIEKFLIIGRQEGWYAYDIEGPELQPIATGIFSLEQTKEIITKNNPLIKFHNL